MRKSLTLVAVILALSAMPATAAKPRKQAEAEVQFGIDVAQKGLWKEAIYRWEKAIRIDPTYAAAYNDLAIAYEHEGLFDKAREAYAKALELDPGNASIKQNFEFFKELNDRAKSRTAR
jgi:Tfp pilus assembly protein PilF